MSPMSDDCRRLGRAAGRGYDAALLRRLLALPPALPLAGRWRAVAAAPGAVAGWRWSVRGSPSTPSTWRCRSTTSACSALLAGSTWRPCSSISCVEYGGTLLTAYIGQRVMYDLRMQIFAHLQRLSIRYFDRNPGRPADDPGDLRRRDAERAVLLRAW